jgi:hypothetical protein
MFGHTEMLDCTEVLNCTEFARCNAAERLHLTRKKPVKTLPANRNAGEIRV